jgi:hypothetical protein
MCICFDCLCCSRICFVENLLTLIMLDPSCRCTEHDIIHCLNHNLCHADVDHEVVIWR